MPHRHCWNYKTKLDMAKKPTEQEIRQQNVAEAVSKTELFFREHSKAIYGCIAAILIIALAIFSYNHFVLLPKTRKAQAEMAIAEQRFTEGNFELALKGDDNNLGFEQILDQYGTRAGKSIYMYAGACALNLGLYDDAIEYYKKYEGKDLILYARAQAGIGDAYASLGDNKSAVSYYEKAAATIDNVYAAEYLMKAGLSAEELGDKAKALEFYKKVKDQYPTSPLAEEVDKYITRIEL